MARSLIAALANHLRRRGACFVESISKRGGGINFSSDRRLRDGTRRKRAASGGTTLRSHPSDSPNRHDYFAVSVNHLAVLKPPGFVLQKGFYPLNKDQGRGKKDWHTYHGFSFVCAALALEKNLELCNSSLASRVPISTQSQLFDTLRPTLAADFPVGLRPTLLHL